MKDTIAAISTPRGFGGIGVVRISGPAALEISNKIFSKKIENPNYAYAGSVIDPETGDPVDTCVAIYFKAPHSYTGEDVVELQMHGGIKNLELVLNKVISLGARVAEKGEFTRRAVLNGKMDLLQAQAVMELIEAKTEKSLRLSSKRLFGEASKELRKLREGIISVLSEIEAAIDFPYDVESPERHVLKEKISSLITEVERLLDGCKKGKKLQDGFTVVISGKPNVGKSTLLNALLRYDRAIVSEVPGTTRDTIEEMIDFRGMPVRIIDTAGFRETDHSIEVAGIERTLEAIEKSDLVLFVFDASEELSNEDLKLLELTSEKSRMLVLNKSDLPQKIDASYIKGICPRDDIVEISALLRQGIEDLESRIYGQISLEEGELPAITSEREKNALEKVLNYLREAAQGEEDVLIAEDLREAAEEIGSLSSSETSGEILDEIFSRFCIGK